MSRSSRRRPAEPCQLERDIAALYGGDCEPVWRPARRRRVHAIPDVTTWSGDMDSIPCILAHCRQPHPAHDWEVQPGMTPVRCGGVDDPHAARFEELAALEAGWLDGQGEPVRPDVIAVAAGLAGALPAALRPLLITPTESGGIDIEWRDHTGTHSITINPDGTLFLLSDDLADGVAPVVPIYRPMPEEASGR